MNPDNEVYILHHLNRIANALEKIVALAEKEQASQEQWTPTAHEYGENDESNS